jgi:hypothetical protein
MCLGTPLSRIGARAPPVQPQSQPEKKEGVPAAWFNRDALMRGDLHSLAIQKTKAAGLGFRLGDEPLPPSGEAQPSGQNPIWKGRVPGAPWLKLL